MAIWNLYKKTPVIISIFLLLLSNIIWASVVCAQEASEHSDITLAIRSGHYDEAIRLIDQSARSTWLVSMKVFQEVAEPNKHVTVWGGKTPAPKNFPLLSAVAALGEVSVAQALLKKGAEVNARLPPGQGSTALMFAAKVRNLEMVRFLLSKGADPTMLTTDSHPTGALELSLRRADSGDDEQVALELLKPTYAAAIMKAHSALQLRVALETAAYNGLGRVMRRLKELKMNITERNQLGATPLHYALMGACTGCDDVALYLIDQGADLNQYYATDRMLAVAKIGKFVPWVGRREGKTPLLIAIDEGGDITFIERLLKKGADIQQASLAGMTPMVSAKKHGREDLLKLFEDYEKLKQQNH